MASVVPPTPPARRRLIEPLTATMKSPLTIVLALELGFAVWLASTPCLLRTAMVNASRAYHDHPSAETAAVLRHQQLLSSITPFLFGACIFGVLASTTLGMAALREYILARRASRKVRT